MKPLSDDERRKLCESASKAVNNAYAPYSGSGVGAAVIGVEIHIGANVENASYGASLCAERSALAAARAAGDNDIRGMAIVFAEGGEKKNSDEMVPCGLCMQWIAELGVGAEIYICNTGNKYVYPDLLPKGFELKSIPVRISDYGDVRPAEEERKP